MIFFPQIMHLFLPYLTAEIIGPIYFQILIIKNSPSPLYTLLPMQYFSLYKTPCSLYPNIFPILSYHNSIRCFIYMYLSVPSQPHTIIFFKQHIMEPMYYYLIVLLVLLNNIIVRTGTIIIPSYLMCNLH